MSTYRSQHLQWLMKRSCPAECANRVAKYSTSSTVGPNYFCHKMFQLLLPPIECYWKAHFGKYFTNPQDAQDLITILFYISFSDFLCLVLYLPKTNCPIPDGRQHCEQLHHQFQQLRGAMEEAQSRTHSQTQGPCAGCSAGCH